MNDEQNANNPTAIPPRPDCLSCDDTGVATFLGWNSGVTTSKGFCPDCKRGAEAKKAAATAKAKATREAKKAAALAAQQAAK